MPACGNLLDAQGKEVIKTGVISEPKKHILWWERLKKNSKLLKVNSYLQ